MKSTTLTAAGGWIAIAGSVIHLTTTPIFRVEAWQQAVSEGWWSTVRLQPTAQELPIAEAFWFTPGSFAVPMLLLGILAVTGAREGRTMPPAFGWILIVWGLFCTSLLPISGAPAFVAIGVLFLLGARKGERAAAADRVVAARVG